MNEAKAIALAAGFAQEDPSMNLVYSPTFGSLVWEISRVVYTPAGTTQSLTLLLDGHTGAELGTRTEDVFIVD